MDQEVAGPEMSTPNIVTYTAADRGEFILKIELKEAGSTVKTFESVPGLRPRPFNHAAAVTDRLGNRGSLNDMDLIRKTDSEAHVRQLDTAVAPIRSWSDGSKRPKPAPTTVTELEPEPGTFVRTREDGFGLLKVIKREVVEGIPTRSTDMDTGLCDESPPWNLVVSLESEFQTVLEDGLIPTRARCDLRSRSKKWALLY